VLNGEKRVGHGASLALVSENASAVLLEFICFNFFSLSCRASLSGLKNRCYAFDGFIPLTRQIFRGRLAGHFNFQCRVSVWDALVFRQTPNQSLS
jgi:hypothetical protein